MIILVSYILFDTVRATDCVLAERSLCVLSCLLCNKALMLG